MGLASGQARQEDAIKAKENPMKQIIVYPSGAWRYERPDRKDPAERLVVIDAVPRAVS